MEKYYVNQNTQLNGDHEVHVGTCKYLPDISNRKYLGEFNNCMDAVKEAKKFYPKSNGCFYCCYSCHTS